jgi:hypothetical protein
MTAKGEVQIKAWESRMRLMRRKGLLTDEQVAKLHSAGFDWVGTKGKTEAGWRELEEHYKTKQRPPKLLIPDEASLHHFDARMVRNARTKQRVLDLRATYGSKDGKAGAQEKWAALESFYREEKRPPRTMIPAEKPLAHFESRHLHSASSAAQPERIKALRAKFGVKGRFEVTEENWLKLERYLRTEGDIPSQRTPLGRFYANVNQRQRARLEALTKKCGVKS